MIIRDIEIYTFIRAGSSAATADVVVANVHNFSCGWIIWVGFGTIRKCTHHQTFVEQRNIIMEFMVVKSEIMSVNICSTLFYYTNGISMY